MNNQYSDLSKHFNTPETEVHVLRHQLAEARAANRALRASEQRLRESEERFRSIVHSMDDVIFVLDSQGRHTGVYGSWIERAGLTPEMFLGKTAGEVLGQAGSAIHMHACQQALQGQQVVYEWRAPFADGPSFFQTRLSPIRSPDGTVTGVVGVGREITDLKWAEDALAEYARKLENSNQELENFAYVASHDLQEPLRKIASFGSSLYKRLESRMTPDERERFERILSAAARMQGMIRDLLELSRVTTQGQPFAPVDLQALVEELVSDLDLRSGRVEAAGLPVIRADSSQMRSLFLNLLSNALKYHRPDAAPEISLRAESIHSRRGEMVKILVQDNGIGFDEQWLERIFQPFQRLHGRGVYDGTGMGLAICRKIVERHGGSLTAASRPGHGSTFIAILPVEQAEVKDF
jgi:PAS domain S-box-containing protein